MKRNKWLLSLAVGLLCCGSAYAQTTVKGKITSESGEPLIGATIAVKNSTDGTVTDIDGNYSLKTKKTLNSKDLLLFSYVGYKTLHKNYTGNTMNVKLAEESQQLNDVVVTALGIKREEKGLGYATETVKGDVNLHKLSFPISNDVVSQCTYRVEDLFSFTRILYFNAIFTFQNQDDFECVNGVKAKTFVAKQRGFIVNIFRSDFFKVQLFD